MQKEHFEGNVSVFIFLQVFILITGIRNLTDLFVYVMVFIVVSGISA